MYKKIITFFSLLFLCGYSSESQNVSYNLNSIPITGTNNSGFGFQSLFSNTTGYYNSSLGFQALRNNTTGRENTGVGYQALRSNIDGIGNTATGSWALHLNTSGVDNSAFGYYTMYSNTSGGFNSAFGPACLQSNTVGNSNSAFGNSAIFNNTSGSYNTGIGDGALFSNTIGNNNTAVGAATFGWLSSGSNNTAVGYFASNDYLSGNINNSTALGSNTKVTANNATALGFGAIANNSNSIQLGNSSVTQIFAGTGTTAKFITGGLQVTGGSIAAGKVLTSDASGNATWQVIPGGGGGGWSLTGNSGTIDGTNFIGTTDLVPLNFRVNGLKAGRLEFIDGNTSFGCQSANSHTSAGMSTAIGCVASYNITSGYRNTSLGFAALYTNVEGNENTAAGSESLWRNKGDGNTGYGYHTLYYNETGKYNTAIGWDAGLLASNLSNTTALGASSIVNASNKIRLGDATVTVVEGPVAYTVSDGRFKKNISEADVKGLDFVNRLRPVVYNFDTRQFQIFLTQNMPDSVQKKYLEHKDFNSSTNIRQSGFIAQEVEAAAKEAGYDFNGVHVPENEDDNYSLSYSQFVVPLVKSVQELSEQNEELKKEIAELRALIMEKKNTEGTITISESGAKLYQNAPNPFNQSTTIKYSLPPLTQKASIVIRNSAGVVVKEYQLGNKTAQVNIFSGQLAAGTYNYSLLVDGKLVDTKQMILTQ